MKKEQIDMEQLHTMEKELGCTFCEDGIFAEMSLDLPGYTEKTAPIPGVEYGFYQGDMEKMKALVDVVDEDWSQYFNEGDRVFCAFIGGEPVAFCGVDTDAECMLCRPGIRVGSIGCVGTLPAFRERGIGLRMVDLATVFLRDAGCDKCYISYTHLAPWYGKLGYETFARFSFNEEE